MKKKILLLPIAVIAMSVTSCSIDIFSRHSFNKTMTAEEFNSTLDTIKKAQVDKDDLLTSNSESGNIKIITKLNAKCKVEGATTRHDYNDSKITINYDKSKNTIYQTRKSSGLNSSTDAINILKNPVTEGDRVYYDRFMKNNITGSKLKYPKNDDYDSKYKIIDSVNEIVRNISYFSFYPSCDFIAPTNHVTTLTYDSIDGDDLSFLDFAKRLCKIDNNLEKNLIYAKHDGDYKSASVTFKVSTTFKNYLLSISEEEEGSTFENIYGTVDIDLFWGIEDNFITQIEGKITTKDCKATYVKETTKISGELEHESYFRFAANYTTSSIPEINESEYPLQPK